MPVRLVRGALVAAIAAVLAACSGGTPVGTTPPGAAPLANVVVANGEHVVHVGSQVFRFGGSRAAHAHVRSWVSPAARIQPVLYGSSYDGGFINIYPQKGSNQAPIGQLSSGLLSPQGMHVDAK